MLKLAQPRDFSGKGLVGFLQLKTLRRVLLELRYLGKAGGLKLRHRLRVGRLKLRSFGDRFLKPLLESSLTIPCITLLLFTGSLMFTTIVLTVGLSQVEGRLDALDARLSPIVAGSHSEGSAGDGDLQGVREVHPSFNQTPAVESSGDSEPTTAK